MKKIIFLLLLVVSSLSYGQQQIIKFPGFTSYWNPKTLIPDSVIWTIKKDLLEGHRTPRSNKFHSSGGRQNLKRDYANSGYDQGHNSPYDDNYYNDSAEYQCFDYVNMFGQLHVLNAQTWERLEDYSRKIALQYGSCKVKTSWSGIDKTIGQDKVVVPLYCQKQIWYNIGSTTVTEVYIMPNRDTVIKHPFLYYKVK